MSKLSHGFRCPRCGGATRVLTGAYHPNSKVYVRQVVCRQCGWVGYTTEVVSPDYIVDYAKDEARKMVRVAYKLTTGGAQ